MESVATRQMDSLTTYFPQQSRILLQGDLVCYGRAVVYDEWPLMASGRSSAVVDDWVVRIDTAMVDVPIQTAQGDRRSSTCGSSDLTSDRKGAVGGWPRRPP